MFAPSLFPLDISQAGRFTGIITMHRASGSGALETVMKLVINTRASDQTLLEELAEIDAAHARGESTPEQQNRGDELVTLANAAHQMLYALKVARELFYTLGDRDTQEGRDCFLLFETCDEAIAQATVGETV